MKINSQPDSIWTLLRQVTDGCLRPGGTDLTRRGLDLCAFKPGSLLLDLGCGPGANLAFLADSGFCVLGLDRSPEMLAEAVARGSVLCADAARLPLADECLDGIVCECVLSLVPDKALALGQCARVLKPGGRLLLSDLTVTGTNLVEPHETLTCCAAGAVTVKELRRLLEEAGFKVCALEDHSRKLAELAARLVWHGVTLTALSGLCQGGATRPPSEPLGYWLVIAEKTGGQL